MDWRGPSLRTAHLGPACRLGAGEWGLNVDRLRDGVRDADIVGPQVKFAADLVEPRLGVALSLGVGWRNAGDRRPITGLTVPVTLWLGGGQLQLHANLGVDHDPALGRTSHTGIAADWALDDRWTLTVEQRRIFGSALGRAGVRFNLTPLVSIDMSVAQGSGQRVTALGLTVEWERRP